MAGTIVVDTIQSDSSYNSTINVSSKMNFSGGYQVGGYDSALMWRNRWINGKMEVDQRNFGGLVTASSGAKTPVDMCPIYTQGSGSINGQQSSDVPTGQGFRNSLVCTVNTAATISSTVTTFLGGYIEGYNIADFELGTSNAKPFTVSFWVKSSVVGTYALNGVSGTGTTNWDCVKHYTINQANTWEYKTVTFPPVTSGGDTHFNKTNSRGVGLFWGLGCGSNYTTSTLDVWRDNGASFSTFGSTTSVNWNTNAGATFYITGIQVELGTSATPFEHRPYSTELLACKRYTFIPANGTAANFQKSGYSPIPACVMISSANGLCQTFFTNPTPMRTTPAMTVTNPTNIGVNWSGSGGWLGGHDFSLQGWDSNLMNFSVIFYGDNTTSTVITGAYACLYYTTAQIIFDAGL